MSEALLRLSDIRQTFRAPGRRSLQALAGVDLDIHRGETVGIVGESGSGKSTLARVATLLRRPTSGRIEFDGGDLLRMRGAELLRHRQRSQMVFQDPGDSIDPRFSIARTVAEPLRAAGVHGAAIAERVGEALELVGLSLNLLPRHPPELSGGQLQRVAIARALVTQPDFVVLDEPTSSLDVSIQARVLNLLLSLQRERNLTYLFVSHDLAVIRHLATRVAVMYLGRIVEIGPAEAIFARPQHPYTVALLSAAAPAGASRERIVLRGDQPSPTGTIAGCAFASRCWLATDVCRELRPPLELAGFPSNAQDHSAACHYKGEAS